MDSRDGLPVRLGLQLHKFIWHRGRREFKRCPKRNVKPWFCLAEGWIRAFARRLPRELHGAANIALLHASYGQLTNRASARVPRDCRLLRGHATTDGCNSITFGRFGGSALTDTNIALPENELNAPEFRGERNSVTYVPFRTRIFLSVGVSWAKPLARAHLYWSGCRR